jgi:hypothetical protein
MHLLTWPRENTFNARWATAWLALKKPQSRTAFSAMTGARRLGSARMALACLRLKLPASAWVPRVALEAGVSRPAAPLVSAAWSPESGPNCHAGLQRAAADLLQDRCSFNRPRVASPLQLLPECRAAHLQARGHQADSFLAGALLARR